MLNTQQTETNTEYNVNFTAEQFAQLEALTKTWNNKCEGDYESTFVGGVAHAYCDSGILTDGLSGADVNMLTKYFTSDTIYGDVGIDDLEQWVTQLEGTQWETDMTKFCRAVNGVLTAEQTHSEHAFEAALYYCWQCCD
tara:strand:+ start:309 stop:725 length:417 start_codon:yes stop_codon:yes gene_type:complete